MRRNLFSFFASLPALFLPAMVLAASTEAVTKLEGAGSIAGFSKNTTVAGFVGVLINVVLGLLGIVFLVLLIYAGTMYMTAGGDESKIETAKHTITRAIIGLVIVLCSYAISIYVIPAIYCASNPSAQGCPNGLMTPNF